MCTKSLAILFILLWLKIPLGTSLVFKPPHKQQQTHPWQSQHNTHSPASGGWQSIFKGPNEVLILWIQHSSKSTAWRDFFSNRYFATDSPCTMSFLYCRSPNCISTTRNCPGSHNFYHRTGTPSGIPTEEQTRYGIVSLVQNQAGNHIQTHKIVHWDTHKILVAPHGLILRQKTWVQKHKNIIKTDTQTPTSTQRPTQRPTQDNR